MSKQILIWSSAFKGMHHRDLVSCIVSDLLDSYHFLDLKRTDRDTKPMNVWQRLRVLPFDPISELTKPAAEERFIFRIIDEEEEEKDRGCLFDETRLRSTTRGNPPLAKRPTLHVAYLRKTDGHTREGPPRRDACLSRKRAGKKAARRESLSGGDVAAAAEFLRDRGRATRHRHVCIFM